MSKPLQNAHGHGHMDATGKSHHDSTHPSDVSAGAGVTQVGKPFTPMVANAPVLSLSVPHRLVHCFDCTAATLHHASEPLPACAQFSAPLSEVGVVGNGMTPRG